jgi:hypothetical protein
VLIPRSNLHPSDEVGVRPDASSGLLMIEQSACSMGLLGRPYRRALKLKQAL